MASETNATTAVYGHSQGGHATLFAAQLAPTYAPELDIVGAAAIAPPTDLGVLVDRDVHEASGIVLTALAVRSWSTLYPQADEGAIVHETARPFVKGIGKRCADPAAEADGDIPDVVALKASFLSADPAKTPGWSDLLQQNSPSAVLLTVPLLVSQGLADTLVRPDVTENYVAGQCKSGARVDLDTYAGVGHFGVRTVAEPKVVSWLLDRLHGAPVAAGCTTVNS